MAQGDVTVQIVENPTSSKIDTAVTNLRVTSNDKWLMESIRNGSAVVIVHIEEA